MNCTRGRSRFLGQEWYSGPESLLSAGLFYLDLTSYVSHGVSNATYRNIRTGQNEVYAITSSKGLTSFLTGDTEPIEFTFMFLAPYTHRAGTRAPVAECPRRRRSRRGCIGRA